MLRLTRYEPRLELTIGETLDDKYRIERLLGVGGMGAVYLATRLTLGDRVAIKSILSSQNTETNRARFLREARAAAAIRHPNVVQIFDYGQPAGRPPYMVMELLDGPTLAGVVEASSPMLPERALIWFAEVCAAIEAGHRRGVVHRDIKPGNIILARSDDGRETIKVLDFGLARLSGHDGSLLTNPGSMVGTCSYMAPELIESGEASAASDVFALGVLLYELVTGRSPFKAATNAATILRIASSEYDRPASVVKGLPAPLCAGIEAALSREIADRPSSPEQLAALVGAPLSGSASGSGTGEYAPQDVSAVGAPAELEPSVVQAIGSGAGEVTLSDLGFNPHGGEKTTIAEAPGASLDAPAFVGRATELEMLRREFRAVLEGRGRLVVITGDAGIGKSRLMEAFAQYAREQKAVAVRGRFFAYEGDRPPPYETFLWMLAQTRSSASSPAATLRGNRPGAHDEPSLSGDKWQAFESMGSAFADHARGRPQILCLDDLQWATALDLEFLTYLHRTGGPSPTMVVGTARMQSAAPGDDELGRWLSRLGGQRAVKTVALDRFGNTEVRAWFQAVFPGIRMRPQDLRRLHRATSGNPYYLSEVVRRLVDDGQIHRDEHGTVCEPLDDVVLPETVNSVVRGKLDGLGESLRLVLETACVIGEEFRFETLQSALAADEVELESILDDAARRGLLSEDALTPGSDYRFESRTLRSVLYGALTKRRRKRLHRAVVEAIERLYEKTDADRVAKVLAYHHHAVGDHGQTMAWGVRAGRACLRQNDSDQAEVALRRAAEAAVVLHDAGEQVASRDLAELDQLTGALYVRIGRLDEARRLLHRALERLKDDPDPSLRLDALLDLANCQLGRGEFEAGLATSREAIEAARMLQDERHELAARVHAARCAAPRGDLAEAQALLEPVIGSIAAGDGDRERLRSLGSIQALGSAELGWVQAKRGEFDRAEESARKGFDLARQVGDVLAEYRSVSVLGLAYLESGDQRQAIESLESALELARRLSLRRREGIELHNLGEAYYFLDRNDDALRHARAALAILIEVRDRATEGDVCVNIGRMLAAKSESGEARAMLERGLVLAQESGRTEYTGLALCELAELDAREGDLASAQERLGRARDKLAQIDSLYLWRAELGLARHAAAAGNQIAGLRHARRAAELLDAMVAHLGPSMDNRSLTGALEDVRRLEKSLTEG